MADFMGNSECPLTRNRVGIEGDKDNPVLVVAAPLNTLTDTTGSYGRDPFYFPTEHGSYNFLNFQREKFRGREVFGSMSS